MAKTPQEQAFKNLQDLLSKVSFCIQKKLQNTCDQPEVRQDNDESKYILFGNGFSVHWEKAAF